MGSELRRKTPDELLRECQEEDRPRRKGYLKIILGYASGVGKSFRMLDEARRRRERGQDVVVGAVQPRVPRPVASVLEKLEVIPLKVSDGGSAMDLDTLLARAPKVCFVDGLAYDNPPGSRNPTRWQDAEELIAAGIKVVGSVNVQYVAELRDQVEAITGKRATQTVPIAFIKSADEIEIVDAPPEEPIERTPEEQVDVARRQKQLAKLRELALLLAADVVDHQLEQYLTEHGIEQHLGTHERILVCITPRSNVAEMIEIARVIAERFHGDLFVAYVNQPNISPEDRAALEERLDIARAAGGNIGLCAVTRDHAVVYRPQPAIRHQAVADGQSRREAHPEIARHGRPGLSAVAGAIPMVETGHGNLKIFMGYAAGVGKTYQMLEEAQQLKAKGVDVVIAYFEPHNRKDTIAKAEGLESVPRRKIAYRDSTFEEMDAEAVLARRPQVAVVDEFPHTNVPGSERAKRWEDVQLLLDAGIDVLTTMNIQHLESLNDQVWTITGVRVRETIPDWVVQQADEVVMIDLTPRALLNRLERGVVYGREKAERAMQNFFRESTLVALRELALRQAAHEVEQRIEYRQADPDAIGDGSAGAGGHHKILVYVTADPQTAMLVRRAKRVSDFLDAECFAVTVQASGDLARLPDKDREAIGKHLNFARNLHIETRILEGQDAASTLVDFARRNRITQIFVTRPAEPKWLPALSRNMVQRIVAMAKDMQIVIVSDRDEPVMV
jgi:two-component system, OmpR family, sensor histidine kinase KdpD